MVNLLGVLPSQTLARSPVERIARLSDSVVGDVVEARALRGPVPVEPVGVLVSSALPGVVETAEVDGSP